MIIQRWYIALLIALLVALSLTPTSAQDTPTHPRLFVGADGVDALRNAAQTTHAEIWTAIETYADTLLTEPPPAQPGAEAIEEEFRSAGDRLIPLAFSCLITESPMYCTLTRDHLMAYTQWSTWDVTNRRDLGLAHMLVGTSLAYDWIYPTLTEDERRAIADAIAARAQAMYEASVGPYNEEWTNWWAGSYMQNHHSTNNSALGIAALALDGDVAADTRAWLGQASDQVGRDAYLLNQIQDGSWHESVHYQSYLLTMQLAFLTNLRAIEGVDLIPHDYMQRVADWRIYNFLPGRHEFILSYGDFEPWWGNAFEAQNFLRFAASEYGSGSAEWIAQQVLANTGRGTGAASVPWQVFEYLYYDPTVQAEAPTSLPTAQVFPDLGAVIWRTGWEPHDLVFGIKTGGYGGNFPLQTFVSQIYPWGEACASVGCTFNVGHDHADANTFYLYSQSQWLSTEWAGYGVRDTATHNTILIDGQNQFLPGETESADPAAFAGTTPRITAHASSVNFNYLASNATPAYTAITDLRDATRHVVFIKPGYFLMLDSLSASSPHTYQSFIHFMESAEVVDEVWVRGTAAENQVLAVGVVSPQPLEAIVSEDAFPYVRLAPGAGAVTDTRFIQLLYPTNTEGWETRPQVELMEDSGSAALTRVTHSDGTVDDIYIRYGLPDGGQHAGGYLTDAQMATVRRDSSGALKAVYLYGGTYVIDMESGQSLVNNAPSDGAFEATFEGGRVDVVGSLAHPVTLYAPGATEVFANGAAAPAMVQGDTITLRPE